MGESMIKIIPILKFEIICGAFSFPFEQFFICSYKSDKMQYDMFLNCSGLKIYADIVIKKCLQEFLQCTMLFSKYL